MGRSPPVCFLWVDCAVLMIVFVLVPSLVADVSSAGGYLYALLWLRVHLGEASVSDADIQAIVEHIISNGGRGPR
jgi:hypothetical protein